MLQQTTVATVIPYFHTFLERWETVKDLAAADLNDVLAVWAGLGYYARVRNLHKCAQVIAERGGHFPETEAELRMLPGIGPYTAAAVAAIAFDKPAAAVDGNVERVIARIFGIEDLLPGAKPKFRQLSRDLVPTARPGDFAQALMDLGATICTPKRPSCERCPWSDECVAKEKGIAERLPRKAAKAERPQRYAVAFWATDRNDRVFLRRRPESGLLGGMMEVPSTSWIGEPWTLAQARKQAPFVTRWREIPGFVTHGFTHFRIEFRLLCGQFSGASKNLASEGFWCPLKELDEKALPTVMRKLVHHALEHGAFR